MNFPHSPGRSNNPNKRHVPTPQPQPQEPKIEAYFSEDSFIPCRGFCLIECRFLGHSDSIIIDHAHEQQQYAIVRAVGLPRLLSSGVEVENEYQVGDFVYAAIANGRRIEVGGRKMVLLGMEHVLGKFREMPESVLKGLKAQEEREAAKLQPPPAE